MAPLIRLPKGVVAAGSARCGEAVVSNFDLRLPVPVIR